ncbi:MAG TPA: hypothetical protein VFE78_24430 [Gemmataceae bacterium]|jgi:hypothetical protein|nr:hypothetical protein [Gemmataceae bacterium]
MAAANNQSGGRGLIVTLSPCHLVTLSLLLAAGCAGNRGLDGDPLVGGGPPIARPAPSAGTATAGAGAAAPIPPPPTHSATSPAALAAGVPQPLPGDRDLRLGATASLPGRDTDGWRNPSGGATAGARLSAPEPLADPAAARLAPTPAGGAGVALTSAPAANEYVQLQDALRARGVSWQHLEMSSETGEWKFTCTVADPKNKSLLTLHEARSRDRYGLDAIRAAIQEIDQPQAKAPH